MKKVLYVVLALSMVLMLSVGAAMAKTQDGAKGNAVGTQPSVQSDTGTLTGSGDVEIEGTVEGEKSSPGQQLKEFKQKLEAYQEGEIEDIPDVTGHWAEQSIKKMKAIGIFKGYEDGTFRPEDSITQAEITVLVMRLANDDTEQEEALEAEKPEIKDPEIEEVPDWAQKSVRQAVYKGFVNPNRFHSQEQASRAMVAVELAKSLGLTQITVDPAEIPFKDGVLISQEDLGWIMALYQRGIMVGTPEGNLNPETGITRAEMTVIMERVINQP